MTLTATALALALTGSAEAATWSIDASHTRVGFKVRHLMVSWVQGEFADVSGTVEYDPAAPAKTSATVTVQMASVDTRDAKRDEHLRSADFFDVAKYPTMSFTSTSVKQGSGQTLQVLGDLTIRGVTRPVTLVVDGLGQPVTDPWGSQRVGATATATINRQDFGVSWNGTLDSGGVVVGDEVQLVIDVQLVAKK
jgi:polyisoprenoid-binding protein YceI